MWSAIPVALLCMVVSLCEGKQGSGPEGDILALDWGAVATGLATEVATFKSGHSIKKSHWSLDLATQVGT